MNIALDICCGKGGWALGFQREGYLVVGVDIVDYSKEYPGIFIQANILTWESWRHMKGFCKVVVASVPCDEFSRWCMPWTRKRNPPKPNLDLWKRAEFIANELEVPLIQENVRAAQEFIGKSKANCGPFHLWGDVPAIVPVFTGKKKESYGSRQKAERAVIPEHLARHIARCFKNL